MIALPPELKRALASRPLSKATRAKYANALSSGGEEWNVSMPSRGLGDTVAKLTTKLGIKPCGGCKKRQKKLNQLVPFKRRTSARASAKSPFVFTAGRTPEYITSAQRMEDAKRLAGMLPADTSLIVGVARSGLTVACMVAEFLHRPIAAIRQNQNDIVEVGSGWRLTGNTTASGPVVVIDDTALTGNSLKHVMPLARAKWPNVLSAVLYCSPSAKQKPNIWVRDLPWPHLLEWNLFNSIISPHCATDFDGILCHDPQTPADDDDGPRYERFLRDTKPLYLTRKVAVPMIVTARVEKYRPHTEEWLRRYGVSCNELVMAPWPTSAERRRHDMAAFKAEHYKRFLKRRHSLKPPLFIESDQHQAARIAEMSGGYVVCPAVGRVFSPGSKPTDHTVYPQGDTYPAVEVRNLIYHVYAPFGSDEWKANLDKLRPHRQLFNGKVVIAVASDTASRSRADIAAYLGWDGVEWIDCNNNRTLRETASLRRLLEAVQSTAANEATFYGHTKGTATVENMQAVRRWRNAMYHHLLGHADECMEYMRHHAAVGTTRISWQTGTHFVWPSGLTKDGNWMFSGTFFWFRNEQVFSRPEALQVVPDRYGAEAWIGRVLPLDASCTIYQPFDERYPGDCTPYNPEHYSAEFDQ